MEYLPDSIYGGDMTVTDGKEPAHEDEASRHPHQLGVRFDELADLNRRDEMGVHLDRRAQPALDGIQHQFAERLVRECHQHAAMDDAAIVGVTLLRDKAELPPAIFLPLQKRTGEAGKIVMNDRLPSGNIRIEHLETCLKMKTPPPGFNPEAAPT
jgi:hypothetical protein